MNYGFLDAQNFAWKFHLVESSFLHSSVLSTYEMERKLMAQKLIDFDATYADLFSSFKAAPEKASGDMSAGGSGVSVEHEEEDRNAEFVRTFKQNSELTSGYGVDYGLNCLNRGPSPEEAGSLFNPEGTTLCPGRIFPPITVTRVSDARIAHLEQEVPQNGSYRIYIFGGHPATTSHALSDFSTHLLRENSFFQKYRRQDIDIRMGGEDRAKWEERHNPLSLFFTFCFVFNARRAEVEVDEVLPGVLRRCRYLVYTDDAGRGRGAMEAAHGKVGFDVRKGGVVVVRPDGYVGCTIKLVAGNGTVEGINEYFEPIVTERIGRAAKCGVGG